MKEQIKVMYESDTAAQKVTVTGWRSRNGHFYGDNEHLARWDGCTHLICECGREMTKGWTKCDGCRDKIRLEKYEAMPFKDWDGSTPLVLHDDDTYFWDEDDVLDHCEYVNCKAEDLRLVICEPQHAWEVQPDEYLCDILPEDTYIADVDPELAEAFETLNKLIRQKKKPISWTGGKFRTAVKSKSETVAA